MNDLFTDAHAHLSPILRDAFLRQFHEGRQERYRDLWNAEDLPKDDASFVKFPT